MSLRRLLWVLAPPRCIGCGAHAAGLEPLCGVCRRALRWLGREAARCDGVPVWAPVAYDGPARALVAALKFRGLAAVAEPMASAIAANAPPGWLEGAALVPVPLHPARRRRRGFNQAERIAAALGRRTGARVADCLARRGSRVTQMGRARGERLRGVEGSVLVRGEARAPADAVLVDDVVTTGATLAACARALHAGGARRVRAVAFARTPGR